MVLPAYMSIRQRPADDLANVYVFDATGSGLGTRVADALRKAYPLSPAPQVKELAPERLAVAQDSAVFAVVANRINGFISLDSNTTANKSVAYEGRNASSIKDVEALMDVVKAQVLQQRLEHEGLDPAKVTALTAVKLKTKTEKIGNKGRETGGGVGNLALGYVVSILLYMMIALYGQQILRGVLEEKTTRVAEVVVSSVSPDTLLAGKILGSGMVAITQVVSWIVLAAVMLYYAAPLIFNKMTPQGGAQAAAAARGLPTDAITAALPTPGTALVMLGFFVLGFLFYAALFGAAGSMVSSQEDVQQAALPVMLMLISSVIFMQPILLAPNTPFARVMTLIPFSAPILMPLRMSMIAVPWWELALSLGGVALAAMGSIWLSARIYRVGLLMYGKKPSFSELARWVKYSN
jgi:ABC-2 type transport system permease protein